MDSTSLQQLVNALQDSWPVDAKNSVWGKWTPDNPARGQCVPSALVVQDFFGGDIVRYRMTNDKISETHYFNVLDDGTVIDTTRSQY